MASRLRWALIRRSACNRNCIGTERVTPVNDHAQSTGLGVVRQRMRIRRESNLKTGGDETTAEAKLRGRDAGARVDLDEVHAAQSVKRKARGVVHNRSGDVFIPGEMRRQWRAISRS